MLPLVGTNSARTNLYCPGPWAVSGKTGGNDKWGRGKKGKSTRHGYTIGMAVKKSRRKSYVEQGQKAGGASEQGRSKRHVGQGHKAG